MSSRLLAAISILTLAGVSAVPSLARAESAESPPPAATDEKPKTPVVPEVKKVEKAESAPALDLTCPSAAIPVYVDTWGRLADLTAYDAKVGEQARFWARRHDGIATFVAAGTIIGGGAILLGTVNRLTNDSFSTANKWEIGGGAVVMLASALAWWLVSPDRDDFLTVINHWNLRHRDRPLAP